MKGPAMYPVLAFTFGVCLAGGQTVPPSARLSSMQPALDKAAAVVERQLELKFAPEERREFDLLQREKWNRSPEGRQSLLGLARTYDQVQSLAPDKKAEARRRFPEALLATARQQRDRPLSKLLLSAYEPGHSAAASESPNGIPAELIGEWEKTITSSVSFSNRARTSFSKPTGAVHHFEFSADGRYKESHMLQVSFYGCNSMNLSTESGSFQVNGGVMTVVIASGKSKHTDDCHPNQNYEKPTETRRTTYAWQIAKDGSKLKLCMLKAGEKQPVCTYKK